jgi:hypothetical protein
MIRDLVISVLCFFGLAFALEAVVYLNHLNWAVFFLDSAACIVLVAIALERFGGRRSGK